MEFDFSAEGAGASDQSHVCFGDRPLVTIFSIVDVDPHRLRTGSKMDDSLVRVTSSAMTVAFSDIIHVGSAELGHRTFIADSKEAVGVSSQHLVIPAALGRHVLKDMAVYAKAPELIYTLPGGSGGHGKCTPHVLACLKGLVNAGEGFHGGAGGQRWNEDPPPAPSPPQSSIPSSSPSRSPFRWGRSKNSIRSRSATVSPPGLRFGATLG
eukprot:6847956-Pyramimonas_sp.AAC.1